jgi:hypothetical protein
MKLTTLAQFHEHLKATDKTLLKVFKDIVIKSNHYNLMLSPYFDLPYRYFLNQKCLRITRLQKTCYYLINFTFLSLIFLVMCSEKKELRYSSMCTTIHTLSLSLSWVTTYSALSSKISWNSRNFPRSKERGCKIKYYAQSVFKSFTWKLLL